MSKTISPARALLGSVQRLLGWEREARRGPRQRRPQLRFESLESRELLAITAGPEFRVNNVISNAQQTFAESNRTAAMNAEGRSVIVWSSFGQDQQGTWAVIAQVYNANGGTVGGSNIVNQTFAGDQRYPTVAMADDGSYVVTWTSNQPDATGFDIYARRYNASGTPLSQEFRVNTTTTGDQRYSRISMAGDGSFVITWTDGADGAGDVYFQRYNASGVAQGSEVRINQTTNGDQSFSTVAVNDDGSFVVTWSSNQTGNYDIFFRRYSATGQPLSAETRVNTTLAGNQIWSDVAVDPFGNFTVTWTSDNGQDGDGSSVMTRLYNASGAAFSGEIVVNGFTTGDQGNSTIATDGAGNFVITWESNLEDGSGWGIYGQRFNFFGAKIGDPFQVNTGTVNDQRFPTVVSNASGNFTIVWSTFNQVGGSDWDIAARRFTQIRPIANPDSATTLRNTAVTVNVLTNDTAPAGSTLVPSSVIVVTQPTNGTVNVNANGTITYTPVAGFTGVDTFTYAVADNTGTYSLPGLVTITVTGLAPVAVDDNAVTPEDTPVAIDVLANDFAPDGVLVPSSVVIVTPPLNGSAVVNPATGVITYTPNLDYNGPDSFTYRVRDDKDQLSNVATVSITVTPENDGPVARPDNALTQLDQPVVINVLANDTDPDNDIDPTTVTIVAPPSNGAVVVNPVTGAVTYTPNAGFTGTDTFTYTVDDLTGLTSNEAVVTVRVNAPPVANNDVAVTPEDFSVNINILANDTDSDGTLVPSSVAIVTGPANGTLIVNPTNGVVTYTPNPDYFGADSFTYTVRDNDGAVSNVATVNITILSVNDPPVAVDDFATTDVNAPVTIDVLANDFDIDGTLEPSTVTIITGPTHGVATVNPVTGEINYTPNAGFAGGDLIVYIVQDDEGGVSNQASVVIRVGQPASLSGVVYLDSNNNGVMDGGEIGLTGVGLTLLKTDGPITFVLNTTTAADGSYSFVDLFPGTYTLVQTQPGIFLDGKDTPAPGIPVGTIGNDQFIGIQLGSGVSADGFNFGERGVRAEFLSSYLGARVFLASASRDGGLSIVGQPVEALNLAAGDIWLSIDGGWTGLLEFASTPQGGTAGMTLYNNNLQPVASAVPTSGSAKFSYTGTTGTSYFLRISGTSSNVSVTAVDPTPAPVNLAPSLPPIADRTLQPGQTTSFIVKATDANPGDKLGYFLAGNAPNGAKIDAQTGHFTWTAPANFAGSVTVTIVVRDDGSPTLSDYKTFTITAGQTTSTPKLSAAEANSFVRSLYVDLLGRGADAGGLNAHVQRMLAGASREEIVAAFTTSTEYLGRVVDGMYSKYLHRRADAGGRAYWIASMQAGATQNDVALAMINSVEYVMRRTSNAAFVDGLYRDILGRAPDAAGMSVHLTSLQGGASRTTVTKAFLSSKEYVDRVIAEQFGKLLERRVDAMGQQWYGTMLASSLTAADDLAASLLGSQEYLSKAMRKFR